MIKVVKFGGTSIGTPARLRRAVKSIRAEVERGHSLVVVVSAMGKTTDEVLNLIDSIGMSLSQRAVDEIVSMGERLSARVLWALLQAGGVNSVFLDPSMEEWPIITDSNFGDAEVLLGETAERCRRYIMPLLEAGTVPVICGFIGRDAEGRVTTLGRGASDQTAFLLGWCLDADEVVIVTDVEGVMSADPRIVKNARLLPSIYIEELWDLSVGGAQVLNSKALRFKKEGQKARIVHYRSSNLDSGGTEIVGSADTDVRVWLDESPVAAVTVVGEKMSQVPGLLARFSQALASKGINVISVSTGRWSISFFVEYERSADAVKVLHSVVVGKGPAKAVTRSDRCAMLTVSGRRLIQTPGVVARCLLPLAERRLNVVEVSTSKAEISIFVNWKDRNEALRLVRQAVLSLEELENDG